MLDKFVEALNTRPILWTLLLGLSIYFCAFWLAVLGMFERFPLSFELGFLSAGILVMGYHWAMSRFINESELAQLIQLSFGFVLVSCSMMLVGATMHNKTYEWLNALMY